MSESAEGTQEETRATDANDSVPKRTADANDSVSEPIANAPEELEELALATEQDECADNVLSAHRLRSQTPFLLRLTRRAVIFFFMLLVTLLCFYAAGCVQGFLDKDLSLILLCGTGVSILLALFSAAAAAESLVFLFMQRRARYVFFLLSFLLLACAATVAAAATGSIHLLSRGTVRLP